MSEPLPNRSDGANALPGDYHTHTTYSDGNGTVAESVEQAIAAGLCEIGISDHISAVQPSPWKMPSVAFADLERYIAEVRETAGRCDEVTVLLGIEADYAPNTKTSCTRCSTAGRSTT